MRILIDGRGLLEEVRAGVESYTCHMLDNLVRMYPDNEYILFSYSRRKSPPKDIFQNIEWKHYKWSNLFMSLKWRFWPSQLAEDLVGKVDLVWCPNVRFLPTSDKTKKIVTVHDLSFELMPECYNTKRQLWHWHMSIRENLSKMNKVVAVSKKTAGDIIDIYNLNEKDVVVVYSGTTVYRLDDNFVEKVRDKFAINRDYILYVGTLEPRKNIIFTIKGYWLWRKYLLGRGIKDENIPLLMIVGGEKSAAGEIKKFVVENGIAHKVRILGFVDDKEKNALLSMSRVLIYCSFYEGFGFPPLEAMRWGVPVISTFTGSLGEVLGDGVISVDPFDELGLVTVLNKIWFDSGFRGLMVDRGMRVASGYCWERSAYEFYRVMVETVNK
ncbi:glycosyltransferase family 4 protein [Patescibacteria group bacterium]|nr:glycosyltransferase family 4 protein [Patescibacteria group bacterium]